MIESTARRPVVHSAVLSSGRLDYDEAWALQQALVVRRAAEQCPDTVLLLEHNAVFTIGRRGREEHCGIGERGLIQAGYPVYHVERGGSVTYHGPGQIVGYPILRLARFCSGPKAYVRMLEEVIIRTLARWDILGRRIEAWPGVWVGGDHPAKLAAVGVKIQRGVTMHGFALNVTVDPAPFTLVTPCGIDGCRVTSMAEILGHGVPMPAVRRRIADAFAEVFQVTWKKPVGLDKEFADEPDE